MKQGIIYGGTFLFTFAIVTGLLIYLNSSYENIFQFNFAPKSLVQLSDSTKTDSLKVFENEEPLAQTDSTIAQDSMLVSSLGGIENGDSSLTVENGNKNSDSSLTVQNGNENVKNQLENPNHKKENKKVDIVNPNNDITQKQQQNVTPEINKMPKGKEYTEWVAKVTSIYSGMEPKKAAKIIQTYSDNVARDILYSMNKKTAAKVVSELSPETANRIFRFE